MSKLVLKGKRHHYLFDPSNESTVLKRNGRFGDVFAGVRLSDNERVVIKQLSNSLKSHAVAVNQFYLESALKLEHDCLRTTYEFIKTGDEYFLVQEYINGWTAKSFLHAHKEYRNSVPFVTTCAIKILDALNYLHAKNIFHCDIKPANILIQAKHTQGQNYNNPKIKLIDLGQAKTPGSTFVSRVKPFSMIYSPPEQVLHFTELISAPSDLYALGISMYELITGNNPFGSNHPEMIMHMQVSGEIAADEKIPAELFNILLQATAKNKFPLPPNQLSPEQQLEIVKQGINARYQTAGEMKSALENFLTRYKERKNVFRKYF